MGDGDLEEGRDVVLGPASSVGLEQARDVVLKWTRDGGLGLTMDSLEVARGGGLEEAKVAGCRWCLGGGGGRWQLGGGVCRWLGLCGTLGWLGLGDVWLARLVLGSALAKLGLGDFWLTSLGLGIALGGPGHYSALARLGLGAV